MSSKLTDLPFFSDIKNYLDDISDTDTMRTLAVMLSNNFISCHNKHNELSASASSWLIRQAWLGSKFKNFIALQPMDSPSTLVHYRDNDGKICDDVAVTARTKHVLNIQKNISFEIMRDIYAEKMSRTIDDKISELLTKERQSDTLCQDCFALPIFMPHGFCFITDPVLLRSDNDNIRVMFRWGEYVGKQTSI